MANSRDALSLSRDFDDIASSTPSNFVVPHSLSLAREESELIIESGSQSKKRSLGQEESALGNACASATKKRSLGPAASFADVLERMKPNAETSPMGEADVWSRKHVTFGDLKGSIIFQQIDIHETTTQDGDAAIQLFGISEKGYTVLAHVDGFMPYFYIPTPARFTEDHLNPLKEHLNKEMAGQPIRAIDLVSKRLKSSARPLVFLKISVNNIKNMARAKDECLTSKSSASPDMESPLHIFVRGRCTFQDMFSTPECTYESRFKYTLRFMTDKKIVGMGWIEIPVTKCSISTNKQSNCSLEFRVKHTDLIIHEPVGEWSKSAPLRVLSFDIECSIRGITFPDAIHDPVIQIANMVTHHGAKEPFHRNVFTLKECSPIEGSDVLSYNTEVELLQAWKAFLLRADPDVIIGYNSTRFDMPYLINRAAFLNISDFGCLGRLIDVSSGTKYMQEQRSWGENVPILHGRLQIDLMHFIVQNHPLREKGDNYKLDTVSKKFLGQKKEDVHFTKINELYNGTEEDRRQLAVYCSKDAYLPQQLLDKLTVVERCTDVARKEGVPFNSILTEAREHTKDDSHKLQKANKEGFIVPDPMR